MNIFSALWIKTKAEEIAGVGFEKSNVTLIKPGNIKITLVNCDKNKFEEFKSFIEEFKPIGATVLYENVEISDEHIDFISDKTNIDKETIIKVLIADYEYLELVVQGLAEE